MIEVSLYSFLSIFNGRIAGVLSVFFLSFFTSSCTTDVDKEPAHPTEIETLNTLYGERLAAYEAATEEMDGWPSVDDCDATLWAGLAVFAGARLDLALAEHFPGEIHRRPVKPCWTPKDGDVGSKSTTSNDTLVGYLAGIWAKRDLGAAQRLAKFGEDNRWVMGQPYPEQASRVVLKPNQTGILGRILDKLSGGKDLRDYRKLPPVYFPVGQDYERHIQTIGILLHGELDGVSSLMVDLLKSNHNLDPDDAFLAAVWGMYSGDMDVATDLLIDADYVSPSYVRGADLYHDVHWLVAAKVVLDHAAQSR